MSTGYKMSEPDGLYFLTLQVVHWADIFTRQVYRDIVIDSLTYCRKSKGIYPNVIDFAFNQDFILVYQMPVKEHFVTFLAQDIRTRYNVLANIQDVSKLSKEDYELMETSLLADSSFYRMLTKELSPNNTIEDIKKSEEIAKDVIISSAYYRSILEQDTCLWIISHIDKKKYGPLTRKELFNKAKELNIPEKLQLEYKGYIDSY